MLPHFVYLVQLFNVRPVIDSVYVAFKNDKPFARIVLNVFFYLNSPII